MRWLSHKRVVFLSLVATGLAVGALAIVYFHQYRLAQRVRATQLLLHAARAAIVGFAEERGRYPSSVQELRDYCRAKIPERDRDFREFISDPKGDGSEHRRLDGTGGLFYDPNSGSIEINLDKPVSKYLPLYRGAEREEPPTSW